MDPIQTIDLLVAGHQHAHNAARKLDQIVSGEVSQENVYSAVIHAKQECLASAAKLLFLERMLAGVPAPKVG